MGQYHLPTPEIHTILQAYFRHSEVSKHAQPTEYHKQKPVDQFLDVNQLIFVLRSNEEQIREWGVKYSETERKLVEMNDCALNQHLTQERTIREFQIAIPNFEQKIADQENDVGDFKARLTAAVTVSGAPSPPGDSEDRIYLTQKAEVLRMVCTAPDLGSRCDATGLSANDIFGMMKSVSALVPRLLGKAMKTRHCSVTLWIGNLSLQQCVVTCFDSQWPFSTSFFRA
jgi:hypothetical protein